MPENDASRPTPADDAEVAEDSTAAEETPADTGASAPDTLTDEDVAEAGGDDAAALKRPRRRGLKWVAVGAAVVLVVALVLPVVSVLQPGYYRRYPSLAKRMDHWAVSTHSKISCTECHVQPGIGNFVVFAAKAVPAFYSQVVSGPSTTNLLKAPDKSACQRCHTTYRQVSPAGDLLIPHKAHVQVLGMQCVTCHGNLVHSPNKRGFNRPEMEACLTCHNGDTASNKCTDCHTRKQTPDSHDRKDWLLVHGKMASSQECGKCHDWTPKYCQECHKQRPASHVGNWKKNHGPEAKTRGNGCLVCHDKTKFCGECH